MPKVIFSYLPEAPGGREFKMSELLRMGKMVQKIVAKALSTKVMSLSESDVDWVVQRLQVGSIVPSFGIEIETIGFQDRKDKLSDMAILRKLKEEIFEVLDPDCSDAGPSVNPSAPLIWIKFHDVAGMHF